jgi:hypothetical protein
MIFTTITLIFLDTKFQEKDIAKTLKDEKASTNFTRYLVGIFRMILMNTCLVERIETTLKTSLGTLAIVRLN